MFGIGEGLDFTYINLFAAPMVSGRVKVIEFERTLSKRLGISIQVKQGKDYNKVFNKTKQMIDSNNPVLAYVDMPYMDYKQAFMLATAIIRNTLSERRPVQLEEITTMYLTSK